MAFTTGSGTFTNMMGAIVTHAVADGWTETGGLGTGFPLNINDTYVDYETYTQTDDDFTTGVNAGPFTATYMRMALGTDASDATSNLSDGVRVPNAHFTITNYYIYSDSASGTNYIHCVFQFSNGTNDDVYQHFSFGEIDKGALTHDGIGYVSSRFARGYAESQVSGSSALDWNSINRGCWPFSGAVGENDDGFSETSYMIYDHTNGSPVDSVAGYPASDTFILDGTLLWDSTRSGRDVVDPADRSFTGGGWKPGYWSITNDPMPFAGAVSLNIFPFILANGTGSGNSITWCGQFPDVRVCSMKDFNPGDEIVYSGDTWQIFPWTRKTDNALLTNQNIVTSGLAGMAYKKVI